MIFPLKKPKKAILTIHGFGKKTSHEFDPLAQYFKAKKIPVIQFDIYDIDNPEDAEMDQWIQRCEEKVLQARRDYDEIILLGFSMGGVIASYLASVYKIKSLILVAPAFQYMDIGKIGQQSVKTIKKWTSKEENIEKPSSAQTSTFQAIVANYKESISQVDCPVLFLHGTSDEVISVESSKNAYKKVNGEKRLLFFEGGKHRMLYDNTIQDTIFPIIECMVNEKLF